MCLFLTTRLLQESIESIRVMRGKGNAYVVFQDAAALKDALTFTGKVGLRSRPFLCVCARVCMF